MKQSKIDTVIFDMDGLLIDSEPLWEASGSELLESLGCHLTHDMYASTTGLRTREWLQYWFNYFNLKNEALDAAEHTIISSVIEKVKAEGKALPGVAYIIPFFKEKGCKIGLATSSPMLLVDIVIEQLGIASMLDTKTSAEFLPYGKPHPQVFINCAMELGADPLHCLCFEDSFNGMIAAKAAKMKCVVVPAPAQLNNTRWGAADLILPSLQAFDHEMFELF